MGRKIYVDRMSQPARAVIIFCRANGIEAELVPTLISKGQHFTKEYRAVNPLGKLPCLVEDGFSLGESAAILRYLANTNSLPDHWYPAEARKRARVDAALDWHHNNIRRGSAGLVFNRVLAPNLKKEKDRAAADQAEGLLTASLKTLEKFWLKDSRFVAGQDISIADLLMVTELDMLNVLSGATEGKSMAELLGPFPKVRGWMQAVADATTPHYQEASAVLMKASVSFARQKAQLQSKL